MCAALASGLGRRTGVQCAKRRQCLPRVKTAEDVGRLVNWRVSERSMNCYEHIIHVNL
jgi:hypothetical protein